MKEWGNMNERKDVREILRKKKKGKTEWQISKIE